MSKHELEYITKTIEFGPGNDVELVHLEAQDNPNKYLLGLILDDLANKFEIPHFEWVTNSDGHSIFTNGDAWLELGGCYLGSGAVEGSHTLHFKFEGTRYEAPMRFHDDVLPPQRSTVCRRYIARFIARNTLYADLPTL